MAALPGLGLVNSIARIISGGQSGADRAALDVAIQLGIAHGGFVPLGRRAEDGPIPSRYQLQELPTDSYDARTERNVAVADATLILSLGPLTGGSLATRRFARKYAKPLLHLDLTRLAREDAIAKLNQWVDAHRPLMLNVAGPRESTAPGIYAAVRDFLLAAWSVRN